MNRCLKVHILLLNLFVCMLSWNAYSEGILIFEISDTLNKPVQNLAIDISQDGTLYKSYKTDNNGRLVDANVPAGSYKYSFDYGDLHTDTFEVQDGNYTWINLDYRSLKITFLTEEGEVMENKRVTIYKRTSDGTQLFVSEKYSDANGEVSFLLPEGEYMYSTFRGEDYITVSDQNINTQVTMTSGLVTHQTHFRFVNDSGVPVSVFAKDVDVTKKKDDGSFGPFGSVDAKSDTLNGQYYLYNKTENYISCSAGSYMCSVQTKEYGTLTKSFEVDDNTPLTNYMVDFILPDLPKSNQNNNGTITTREDTVAEEVVPGVIYSVTVQVRSSIDSITTIKNVVNFLELSNDPSVSTGYALTDKNGKSYYSAAPSVINVVVANDTLKNITIASDTVLYAYIDTSKCAKMGFDFYYGADKFYPYSVENILIWNATNTNKSMNWYGVSVQDTCYSYDEPLIMPVGRFKYSFNIKEKEYDEKMLGSITIGATDNVVRIPIRLKPSHNVKIVVKNINGDPFESVKSFEMLSETTQKILLTDSLGVYEARYIEGDYTFTTFGDTQKVTLLQDTVLYFTASSPIKQNVKFQFIHDGKEVYPQIMSMNIYDGNHNMYTKVTSDHLLDYEGYDDAWVFQDPIICVADTYYVEYLLKDYMYNGLYEYKYSITNPTNSDTTIYIVVPVKRTVSITIRDANMDLVKGVFGDIYKYDTDGTLLPTLTYDDMSHSTLRSNSSGKIIDYLVPGRYQIRILDIVRDFIVKDYDLDFEIVSGAKMYDVKYIVQYQSSHKPVTDVLFDLNKNGEFFNTTYTDENGTVEVFCEKGSYKYQLHYGKNHTSTIDVKSDTTIYIYVEDPVLITKMTIDGCACLTHGDTVSLNLTIEPTTATMQEVDWSVSNEGLAHVTSDGYLVANDVKTTGVVLLKASAKDGSEMSVTRKFYIGNGECGTDKTLSYGDETVTDIPLTSDSVNLTVTVPSQDQLDYVFLYQVSTDTTGQWQTLYGPTPKNDIMVSTSTFKKDVFFRVLSATTETNVLDFAKNLTATCGEERISSILTMRVNDLKPIDWPDSICSTRDSITLIVDKTQLGQMATGFELVWSIRKENETAYVIQNELTGKEQVTLSIDSTTYVKVSVQKGDNEAATYEGKVFVEQNPQFTLKSSEDTVCLHDKVELSVVISDGEAGTYNWIGENSNQSQVVVEAQDKSYILEFTSRYDVCPVQQDSIRIIIDQPVDLALEKDKKEMCETDQQGVLIRLDSLSTKIGTITWSDGSHADTLRVVPETTTTYSAEVSSIFNRCPKISKDITVDVRNTLSVELSVDQDDICQHGNDTTIINATVVTGDARKYLWWDGIETEQPERRVVLTQNDTVSVVISDGVCADSEADSVSIRVAKPSSVNLSTTTSVFEYGGNIDLHSTTASSVYGSYSWYAVDTEGEETLLSVTDEAKYTDMPNGNVSYYVTVENGACPIIRSGLLGAVLVDNVVIPTVFTPYTVDGQNDDFMPGYPVIIYDRYGNLITHSDNGWDGTYKGEIAEPGVYMYVLTLKDERVIKGTIEIFRK